MRSAVVNRTYEALHVVVQQIDEAKEEQAHVYNRRKRDVRFNVGDRVLCKVHWFSSTAYRFNAKLVPKY